MGEPLLSPRRAKVEPFVGGQIAAMGGPRPTSLELGLPPVLTRPASPMQLLSPSFHLSRSATPNQCLSPSPSPTNQCLSPSHTPNQCLLPFSSAKKFFLPPGNIQALAQPEALVWLRGWAVRRRVPPLFSPQVESALKRWVNRARWRVWKRKWWRFFSPTVLQALGGLFLLAWLSILTSCFEAVFVVAKDSHGLKWIRGAQLSRWQFLITLNAAADTPGEISDADMTKIILTKTFLRSSLYMAEPQRVWTRSPFYEMKDHQALGLPTTFIVYNITNCSMFENLPGTSTDSELLSCKQDIADVACAEIFWKKVQDYRPTITNIGRFVLVPPHVGAQEALISIGKTPEAECGTTREGITVLKNTFKPPKGAPSQRAVKLCLALVLFIVTDLSILLSLLFNKS